MTYRADLTGAKFGKLTVTAFDGGESPRKRWLCRCECGGEKIVRQSLLYSGHTKSCGCIWRIRESESAISRFNRYYLGEPNSGCWLWDGGLDGHGYASFRLSARRTITGHRFSYESYVGPIPSGLQLDHLCRTRSCVNPKHLEPVTMAENIRRGRSGTHMSERTKCPQGHAYTPENTYVAPRGFRNCKICRRAAVRRNQQLRAMEHAIV